MVALCKIGRFKRFTASNFAIMAYGNTLWTSPNGEEVLSGFEKMSRNKKYVSQPAIEIKLDDTKSAWLDSWDPCPQHCKIYKEQILAIASAGGPATSFTEPRSEAAFINHLF